MGNTKGRKIFFLWHFIYLPEMGTRQYLVAGPVGYVKDLFKNIGIANFEKRAIQFYSNMFLFYSLYDGAVDKNAVKHQFEYTVNEMIKEFG